MLHRTIAVVLFVPCLLTLSSCASLQEERDYPADTAILIGDVAYQINTNRCAQIKAIGKDGALDCYDADDLRSPSITPVSEWRRTLLKEKMGMEWASPEHQAFLVNYFHRGGKEKGAAELANSLQQAYGNLAAAKASSNSIGKSRDIKIQEAQSKLSGVQAYVSGGSQAWQAHQMNVTQWRLDNSRYFIIQMNNAAELK